MKLEGIHHITAITENAQSNVDFYAGVLGLAPGQEDGQPGRPRTSTTSSTRTRRARRAPTSPSSSSPARPGAGPGDGMVHTIVWRVGVHGGARLLGRPAEARTGSSPSASATSCASRTPRASATSSSSPTSPTTPLIADHPEVPAELALQGFDGVRAYAADPARAPSRCSARRSASSATAATARWEARGARARRHSAYYDAAAERGRPGRRHGPPRRLGLDDGRARGLARARARRRARTPTPVIDRFWLQVDLLPRAERRALRDRHARPGLRASTRIPSISARSWSCRPRSSTCASRSRPS